MQKIKFTRKVIAEAAAVGVIAILALIGSISQKVSVGQSYQEVIVNGQPIGYTSKSVDVKQMLLQVRREMANESGERLCIDYEWEAASAAKPFVTLLSEDELKTALRETLEKAVIRTCERAYTVAIDGYRANFLSMEDVEAFLEKVKAGTDTQDEYGIVIYQDDSHINGILNAVLTKREAPGETKTEVLPEKTYADRLLAGIGAATAYAMEYAFANPSDGSYKSGLIDLEFVETVEVYENYVDASELSDVDTEVVEVTKEKESNKIYVVESGDCLSVIALDHDTTVSSIVALNGLANADAIRDGQELIIAVPEPDLKIRMTVGEVYEEDYTADAVIIENDSWYTTKEVVLQEGTTGHRERNDVVVYENGIEVSRELVHQNIMVESQPSIIERGTQIPPTYIRPLAGGRYTSGFGYRWGRLHKGVDWACPVGTTVYASCAGTVIQASYNGGYGNNVVISHSDGRLTRYAHNSKLLVRVGQTVKQGEAVALSGNTGRSTGPHVHFEIYINGAAVNPLKYISN